MQAMAQTNPPSSIAAAPSSIADTLIVEGFGVNGLDLAAVMTLKETLGGVFDEAGVDEVRSSMLISLHVTNFRKLTGSFAPAGSVGC
jgi:hypothetical protein